MIPDRESEVLQPLAAPLAGGPSAPKVALIVGLGSELTPLVYQL